MMRTKCRKNNKARQAFVSLLGLENDAMNFSVLEAIIQDGICPMQIPELEIELCPQEEPEITHVTKCNIECWRHVLGLPVYTFVEED